MIKIYGMFNLTNVATSFAISYALSIVPNLIILRPNFTYKTEIVKQLLHKIRSFGLNVMLGVSIFNMTVFLDRLFISLMLNANVLAVYQMAVTFANPIGMFSRSIGISTFRNYIKQDTISAKINILNLSILIIQAIFVILVAPYVLQLFNLEQYISSLAILPFILLAHIFLGMKQPYGFFLIARKRGNAIRSIALGTALISIISFSVFVPIFDLYGALMGLIVTYLFLITAHLYSVHYKPSN
jgi:O-antigen/teichoic acid export membrane protein